jgi:hypothetical protein
MVAQASHVAGITDRLTVPVNPDCIPQKPMGCPDSVLGFIQPAGALLCPDIGQTRGKGKKCPLEKFPLAGLRDKSRHYLLHGPLGSRFPSRTEGQPAVPSDFSPVPEFLPHCITLALRHHLRNKLPALTFLPPDPSF